jgi:hypothetical protein
LRRAHHDEQGEHLGVERRRVIFNSGLDGFGGPRLYFVRNWRASAGHPLNSAEVEMQVALSWGMGRVS